MFRPQSRQIQHFHSLTRQNIGHNNEQTEKENNNKQCRPTKKKKNKTYQSEEARMGKWFWQILANSSICQWIQANFAHKLHTVN